MKKKAQLLKAVLQSSHGVLRLPVLLTADCCCTQLAATAEGWEFQAARILVPMGPKGDGPRKPCVQYEPHNQHVLEMKWGVRR
jgi:hypothetical protein